MLIKLKLLIHVAIFHIIASTGHNEKALRYLSGKFHSAGGSTYYKYYPDLGVYFYVCHLKDSFTHFASGSLNTRKTSRKCRKVSLHDTFSNNIK